MQLRHSVQRSILPGWMMTMPGALLTGFVIALLIRQAFIFGAALADIALPADRALQCYEVPQKLSVGQNTSDSYRARQMQKLQQGLFLRSRTLMELGTKCQAGQCSESETREFHKQFRRYVQGRALRYKYADAYFKQNGRSFFRQMYENRQEELMRDVALNLHNAGRLNLRKMDGYEGAARMFLFKEPEAFTHCT